MFAPQIPMVHTPEILAETRKINLFYVALSGNSPCRLAPVRTGTDVLTLASGDFLTLNTINKSKLTPVVQKEHQHQQHLQQHQKAQQPQQYSPQQRRRQQKTTKTTRLTLRVTTPTANRLQNTKRHQQPQQQRRQQKTTKTTQQQSN